MNYYERQAQSTDTLKRHRTAAGRHQLAERLQVEYVPRKIALAICTEIRQQQATFIGRWRCHRCMQRGYNGIPNLLRTSYPGGCQCRAVNRHYRRQVSMA